MAITTDELVERAKRLVEAGASPSVWARAELDLAACITLAVQECSEQNANNPEMRALLMQPYSVSLNSSGFGDLLAATGSLTGAADIFWNTVAFGTVVDVDGNELVYLPNLFDFYRPQSTLFGYYTLANRGIYARAVASQVNVPSDVQPPSGPLTVTACFAPADLQYWPTQLNDDLVRKLAHIVIAKGEEAPTT